MDEKNLLTSLPYFRRHDALDRLPPPGSVDWEHEGDSFFLVVDTSESRTHFRAGVRYDAACGFWSYHVAMDGSLIVLGEQAERTRAMIECEDAIARAWKLRGPILTSVVP